MSVASESTSLSSSAASASSSVSLTSSLSASVVAAAHHGSVELKVLTYNVFIRPPGINEHGNDFKDERLNEFIKLIDSFDVVCLQELFGAFSSRRDRFIAAAKERGFLHVHHSPHVGWFSGFLVDGGLCIVSKHRIVAHHHVTFPKGTNSDALSAKGAIHVLLDLGRPELAPPAAPADHLFVHLFCTHLQASYYPSRPLTDAGFVKSWQARVKQLAVLTTFVQDCIDDDEHDAILLGDFNVNARPHTHGSAEHELADAKFAGFSGAAKVAVADDHQFHVSDQYTELLRLLASPKYEVFDCLRDAAISIGLSCHPVTIADVVMHGEKVVPRETLLTSADDHRSRQCLDYIFLLQRTDAKSGSRVEAHAVAHPHTHVERFDVVDSHGLTVTQLSDHYGVSAIVTVASRAARRHKPQKRRQSRRTVTASSKSKAVDADADADDAAAADSKKDDE